MFTTKDYLVETLTPAEQAKRLGLKYLGFGRWGKVVNGKKVTTHKTEGDKLVPSKEKKVTTKPKTKSAPQQKKVKIEKGEQLLPWHVPNPWAGADEETSIERLARRRERYAEGLGLSAEWSRPPEVVKEAQSHWTQIDQLTHGPAETPNEKAIRLQVKALGLKRANLPGSLLRGTLFIGPSGKVTHAADFRTGKLYKLKKPFNPKTGEPSEVDVTSGVIWTTPVDPARVDRERVLKDVRMWTDDKVFDRITSQRLQIYETMDKLIDQADLRVTEAKELYRGVYFTNKNIDYAKSFIKMITSGGTIELPPSGFTTTLKVAMDFANIGDPQVSVILRALPPKKGFRAMHLAGIPRNAHEKESEVVTRSSKFQIMSVLEQETRREKTITEPDGRLINVTYTVQLQQLEK
jgi:hypothetical protein